MSRRFRRSIVRLVTFVIGALILFMLGRTSSRPEQYLLDPPPPPPQVLRTPVPHLQIKDATLPPAIREIELQSGIAIRVDWDDLRDQGVDPQRTITVDEDDLVIGSALDRVITDAGMGESLSLEPDEAGFRIVSTRSQIVRRVYDLTGLLKAIATSDKQLEGLFPAQTQGGLGPSAGLFYGGVTMEDTVGWIIQLIQDSVATDSWRDNGGLTGSVRALNSRLVVMQNAENQQAIVELLAELRQSFDNSPTTSEAP